MNKSKPSPFLKRLSLVYSGPDSKSPKLCLMFVEALAVRMTQGLDLETGKQNNDFHKIILSKDHLEKQRIIAMTNLVDAIHNAFVFTEPYLPAKLSREAWEEVDKLPDSLLSHCEERKIPSTKIVELNGLADGLSAIYSRCVPYGLFDQSPKTTFLYTSLVPRLINYNEEYMEVKIQTFRYRFELMEMVDRYVGFLQIPLPDGQKCREFDTVAFKLNCLYTDYEIWKKKVKESMKGAALFPLSNRVGSAGPPFLKPLDYFEAAWQCSGLSLDEFCCRVGLLADAFYKELDRSIEWLLSIQVVRDRLRDVYRLYGQDFI